MVWWQLATLFRMLRGWGPVAAAMTNGLHSGRCGANRPGIAPSTVCVGAASLISVMPILVWTVQYIHQRRDFICCRMLFARYAASQHA